MRGALILAAKIDPLMLDILRALTIPAPLRHAVIAEVRRRLDHTAAPHGAQRATFETSSIGSRICTNWAALSAPPIFRSAA